MFQHLSPRLKEPQALMHRLFKSDPITLSHSYDVLQLVENFYTELPETIQKGIDRNCLYNAAFLHDIGKHLVPESVLHKPGALNEQEKEVMKQHAAAGKEFLLSTPYRDLSDIVCYHHERVDGSGYFGLRDSEIPVESKMIAIADTYSALTSNRAYRSKCKIKKAYGVLQDASGTQLDAELTFLFCKMLRKKEKHNSDGYRFNVNLNRIAFA